MARRKSFFLAAFLVLAGLHGEANAQAALRQQIETYARARQAHIGVGVWAFASSDTLTVGGAARYPMQSVYKLHLALAVLHQVDKGRLALNQPVPLRKADLPPPSMWSPLRDKYPDGTATVPLSEVLRYTVAQSDNAGCDILFRMLGGPQEVEKYLHGLGLKDVAIRTTEAEMQAAWPVQFLNWTTPLEAVRLLERFDRGKMLSRKSTGFLWRILVGTTTGPDRIRAGLPAGTVLGHKTGSSGTNAEGITAATNDIGIIGLPGGGRLAIAVFVSNSREDAAANARIIADITRMVWTHFTARKAGR